MLPVNLPTLALGAVLLLGTVAPAAAQTRAPLPLPLGLVSPEPHVRVAPREEGGAASGLLPVPVLGVAREALRDSYSEGRGRGRTHHAIDIHAPEGTPVVAVADGTILRLHSGDRGGLAIYLLDDDGRTRYYYAHLSAYAEGIRQGRRVERGEVIGYVGDTGNATPGDYHLHFSVATLTRSDRWWEGRNRNPYPLLTGGAAR